MLGLSNSSSMLYLCICLFVFVYLRMRHLVISILISLDQELLENDGLYGLKHHIEEISGDVTDAGRRTITREDRAFDL